MNIENHKKIEDAEINKESQNLNPPPQKQSNGSKKNSFWFDIKKEDQYITVNELMADHSDDFTYYFLLILSSVIIAAGVILANSAIIIGGMLITPLLTPVLLIALGMTTGNSKLMKNSVVKISKSLGIVLLISLIIALIFNIPQDKEFFNSVIFANTINSAFLYFIVAFAAGFAATYAWIRKKVDNMLPGIAIAVSLVPPVSMIGIFLGTGNGDLARFFLMVFLFNIVGIIGGSMILFSMFKFYNSGAIINNNLKKIEKERAVLAELKALEDIETQKKLIEKAEKNIAVAESKIIDNNENQTTK